MSFWNSRGAQKRLQDAREEMKVAIEEGNKREISPGAAEQQDKFQKQLEMAKKGSEKLRTSRKKSSIKRYQSPRKPKRLSRPCRSLGLIREPLRRIKPTENPTKSTYRKEFKEIAGSCLGKSVVTGAGAVGVIGGTSVSFCIGM